MEASSTIKKLFASDDRFEIPNYQRAYAWGKEQLSQFVDDLSECGEKYYLGHFLFEEDGKKPDAYYVIDGQQRLTTCIIFFSAARNALEQRRGEWEGGENAEGIKKLLAGIGHRYLKDMISGDAKFKTVLYDNDFFVDAIIEYKEAAALPEEDTSSKKAMREARLYFEKRLKEASVECMLDWIEKVENAYITTYVVNGKVEGAQIFAYQNDRGKGLSNLEVLKVYLMMQLFKLNNSESIIGDIETIFKDIYKAIARVSLHENTVLNYYWQAIGPKGYKSENAVDEVKAWIKGFQDEEQADKIKKFVADLSKAFCLVEEIDASNSFDVANLKRLDDMAISYPLLIRARMFGVGDKTFNRLVKLMENLTFRYVLRGRYADITGRLQSVINLKGASNDESFDALIEAIKWNLNSNKGWEYWGNWEMIRHISDRWFYGNRMENYLLWRYEQHLCPGEYPETKVSWEDVRSSKSIERVAPQRPPDNLAESGYGAYNDKENLSEGISSGDWLNCVGNLVLLAQGQNSALGNCPFEEKLKMYGSDNLLHQQKEIISFVTDKERPVWDKAAIERRRDAIVAAAREIWDLGRI